MDDLRKAYRTVSVIGLAMIASVFLYAVVVEYVVDDRLRAVPSPPSDGVNTVKFVLLGVCGVLFLVIRAVNAHFLSPSAGGQELSAAPGARAGLSPFAQRCVTAAVVTFALCEVPAVLGLVLYFIGRSTTDFYLFLLLSLLFFAVHFPKYGQWEEVRRRQRR